MEIPQEIINIGAVLLIVTLSSAVLIMTLAREGRSNRLTDQLTSLCALHSKQALASSENEMRRRELDEWERGVKLRERRIAEIARDLRAEATGKRPQSKPTTLDEGEVVDMGDEGLIA